MSCSAIHHVEMCVLDARPTLRLFTHGLGFSVVGDRSTPTCQQWVLQQRNSTFVITQRRQAGSDTIKSYNCNKNTCCCKSSVCNQGTVCSSSNLCCMKTANIHSRKDCSKQKNGLNHTNGNVLTKTQEDHTFKKHVEDVVPSSNGSTNVTHDATHSPDVLTNKMFAPFSKISNKDINNVTVTSQEEEEWTVFCCGGAGSSHVVDSVFNAAIVVRDVVAVTMRVEQQGGRVIKPPKVLKDTDGEVTYAIIATNLGNVVHTLVDKRNYRGTFLPGFNMVQEETSNHNEKQLHGQKSDVDVECVPVPVSTHLDHVAYVCDEGKSTEIIQWYEEIFNMKRFLVNREEDVTEGLTIEEGVGLRLKALEYWKCFETGLYKREEDGDTSLKLVIGEPITAIKGNHVSAFLESHGGPGIQHIALHSPTMLATVRAMAARGVPFRQPPPTYYNQVGKREDMEQVGLGAEAEELMAAGVLLDTEADPPKEGEMEKADPHSRYLMQIFTEPIFGTNSFFLEVVHRAGAEGFGVGNITALARSIALHQHQPLTLKGRTARQ